MIGVKAMAQEKVPTDGLKSIYIHVDRVLEILSAGMTPVEIGQWMHVRIPVLRTTPAIALLKGRVGAVIVAAESAVGTKTEQFPTGTSTPIKV